MTKKEKQERFEVMQREARGFLLAKHFNTVYWDTVTKSHVNTPIVADLIAQFALNILDLKQSSVESQLTALRAQLDSARKVIERYGDHDNWEGDRECEWLQYYGWEHAQKWLAENKTEAE